MPKTKKEKIIIELSNWISKETAKRVASDILIALNEPDGKVKFGWRPMNILQKIEYLHDKQDEIIQAIQQLRRKYGTNEPEESHFLQDANESMPPKSKTTSSEDKPKQIKEIATPLTKDGMIWNIINVHLAEKLNEHTRAINWLLDKQN